ncbi:MAG: hypothetical protein K2X29_09855 [Candidatus Obscuribacterales bacterium]|nr:hypothetical protein [Candidatus Obscuribacterales bacterium]
MQLHNTLHSFGKRNKRNGRSNFEVASHDGEPASISGTVDKIQPNPNKSAAIVLRVYISQGEVSLTDKKDFHPTKKTEK